MKLNHLAFSNQHTYISEAQYACRSLLMQIYLHIWLLLSGCLLCTDGTGKKAAIYVFFFFLRVGVDLIPGISHLLNNKQSSDWTSPLQDFFVTLLLVDVCINNFCHLAPHNSLFCRSRKVVDCAFEQNYVKWPNIIPWVLHQCGWYCWQTKFLMSWRLDVRSCL